MCSSETDSKKPTMDSESSNPVSLFSTKTPDKTAILPTISRNSYVSTSFPEISSRVPIKPVKRQIFSSPQKPELVVKFPERFKTLEEFFNGLDTAIRLLKLKGSLTSFANIRPKIEYLTNRVFSYDHLAQMKHIYSEAIEAKTVLKYDEGTSCMKPRLHINLNTDAIVHEDTSCGTKYMQLRKMFHSKLVDFYKAHPKDEIPKELLPEPFNSLKGDSYSDTIRVDFGAPKLEVDVQMKEMEKEQHVVDKVIPDSTLSDCTESQKEPGVVGTPVKDLSTPSKDLSTPIRLMSATPTLQPSRRCIMMTPDDDNGSVRSTNGMATRPSRTRCLNFDTLEEDGIVKMTPVTNQLMKLRMQNLPKLVNLIHKLFHSTKRTFIAREELLHQMIAYQINITDRREVEEQLRLMFQSVPDWISEEKACTGDLLIRINKMSSAETIRARLEEATSQGISTVF